MSPSSVAVDVRNLAPHAYNQSATFSSNNLNGKNMDFQNLYKTAEPIIIAFGLKVIGAIIAYIVGRWLIGVATGLMQRALSQQKVEPTIIRYLGSFVTVALNVVLVVAILGYFGVETTSFAALIAAIGIAIGSAWAGLLSNFAAGVFILILRPFKVGDYVEGGGVEGTVMEIGLFGSVLNTPDNVRTMVGNAKIMGGNIKNFTANDYRRVDLVAQLDGSADYQLAINLLRDALPKIPNVIATPAPDVHILSFSEFGPVLCVRPYCNNVHYWQVFFDTNKLIKDTFGEAGFPAPERHLALRNKS
jgi:small conductance mechanosensitive channel